MSYPTIPLDIDRLKQSERAYNAHLRKEAADTGVRMTLAWCLALQAIYEAGQTHALAALRSVSETLEEPVGRCLRGALQEVGAPEPNVPYLLRSCLQQVVAVTHLSANPQERKDAEKLRALLELSGGEQALLEADESSERILAEITNAILSTNDDEENF